MRERVKGEGEGGGEMCSFFFFSEQTKLLSARSWEDRARSRSQGGRSTLQISSRWEDMSMIRSLGESSEPKKAFGEQQLGARHSSLSRAVEVARRKKKFKKKLQTTCPLAAPLNWPARSRALPI